MDENTLFDSIKHQTLTIYLLGRFLITILVLVQMCI